MANEMRDRLVEMMEDIILSCKSSLCVDCEHLNVGYPHCMGVHFADHLLDDGWVRPPVKVGDVVWYITGIHRTIVKSAIVKEIIINCNGVSDLFVTSDTGSFENSVDIFYHTKSEAEQKLKEMRGE